MMHRSLAVLAALFSMSACGAPQQGTESLTHQITSYHDGIRWERFPKAAVHVPAKERDDFLDEREELHEDLRIADFEITRLKYKESRERATVQIKYVWHLDSRGIVHKTTAVQEWRRHGRRWLLLSEERLRGEPMPGVPEPPSDEEAGEAGEATEISQN